MLSLEDRIKERAHGVGFELAGIAPASAADGFDRLRHSLAKGFAGDMTYVHRHAETRRHPASILPEVRSVLMVGMNYKPIADCRLPSNSFRPSARCGPRARWTRDGGGPRR